MQTFRVIMSLICRVVLFGIAVPVLLGDFPNYKMPYRFPQEWTVVTVCDGLAMIAPLRAHFYYRHTAPFWDMAYMGVALVFVLLPSSGRGEGMKKPRFR
jgi:hypothetical protein